MKSVFPSTSRIRIALSKGRLLLSSKASLQPLGSIVSDRKNNKSKYQSQGGYTKGCPSSPRDKEEVSLPDLAVSGGSLCDDRAGLGRRHGLLNHNTGVVVGHPGAAELVRSRARHGPTDCIMHGDILPREDKKRKIRRNQCFIYSPDLQDQSWKSDHVT